MERGFVFHTAGLLVSVGCGSHGRFLSRGESRIRGGSQQACELGAVVGNYTPGDCSALVPLRTHPAPHILATLYGCESWTVKKAEH